MLLSALALSLQLAATAPVAGTPAAFFVTWDGDPTTTVSIDWHLERGTALEAISIRGPGLRRWRRVVGDSIPFPYSTRYVRRARISGLRPGGLYELRLGDSTYRYRTMPARLTRPVLFATGGDTQSDDKRFGTTNRMVAQYDLDFVLIGGDLAYSNGDPRLVKREQEWFETVSRTLMTKDRRLIPLIAAIGNHEVFSERDTTAAGRRFRDSTGVRLGEATYYSVLHAHARAPQYSVMDVGNYLTLLLLNSDHTAKVEGEQTTWLADVLAKRPKVPHVFPVYHVPGYPSVRAFSGSTSVRVRQHWTPLFEQAGIRLAFENHDHAYKRSVPLRAGARDSSGVIYLGDGAWGAGPRVIGRDNAEKPEWYLEQYRSVNHAILVTLTADSAHARVIESNGAPVDSVKVARRR
jgi:acid phosphatase type 7